MAQRVEIILIDDIDETPANEKVRFGLDGINYEIDLSAPAPPELLRRDPRRRRSAPGLPRTAMK